MLVILHEMLNVVISHVASVVGLLCKMAEWIDVLFAMETPVELVLDG